MKLTLVLLCFLITSNLSAQIDSTGFIRSISSENLARLRVYRELDENLSHDWIIESNDSIIRLTFCRSCKEDWWQRQDSINLARTNQADSGVNVKVTWETYENRPPSYYLLGGITDSVGYNGWLNPPYRYGHPDRKYQKEMYAPVGILEIEIKILPDFSAEKLDSIRKLNEHLWTTFQANTVMHFGCTPCLHYNHDMRNCRLAEGTLEERQIVDSIDLAIVKEPYYSETLGSYVYSFASMPQNNLNIVYCDKNDEDYYLKKKNFIRNEVYSTLLAVKEILGLRQD